MKVKIKILDVVFILIFLILIICSFCGLIKKDSGSKMIFAKTPKGEFVYPLDKNADLEFDGILGKTKVKIEDGKVWVTESPCKNKFCIQKGSLSVAGDFAACLPNGVIVTVEGGEEEFDVISE
ncbi:MAG: NusG domain II-containing protein [Treponema sp.]|nr:NusG domain II-containing protein [Treponema sp.]